MRRFLLTLLSVLSLALLATAAEKKTEGKADEDAIRAKIDSYVAAYNRGDAKAVAAHWSETGQWTNPDGKRISGRAAIEREMVKMFAESKGVRIEVLDSSVRLVAPDAAVEEGTVRVLRPGEAPSDFPYIAVHVKKDGQWALDSVRETEAADAAPASSPLQDLAWLVGEWVDASPDADGEARVAWTKNKTFLSYSFKVSAPGMDDLEGTQVIGWDPAAGTIRSWMFDSDGGFGEGTWTKKGDTWVVQFSQVLPDGRKASQTNIYTLVDANAFTWRSVGRKLDGQFLPNVDDAKMVRKGTQPAQPSPKPAKPAKPVKPEAKKK